MLAEVLAIYATVVSTGSLVISYFSHRSSGPRLAGYAMVARGPKEQGQYRIHLELFNRGQGPVTVHSMWPIGYGKFMTAPVELS